MATPPACRWSAAVTTRTFQRWLFRAPPSSEWDPARAMGACWHQGDGCCRSPGLHPAGAPQVTCRVHVERETRWPMEPRRGGAFEDAPTGRGLTRGPMGACAAGGAGAGSRPGIPVAAAVFSGTRSPSARSGPPGSRGSPPSSCILWWVSERPAAPGLWGCSWPGRRGSRPPPTRPGRKWAGTSGGRRVHLCCRPVFLCG